MQLKCSGKQQFPVTGKDCSSGICSRFIQERKDEAVGARKPQCVNSYLKQENRVNFTDALFTYNTSTLLSASAHLCPFSCSPSAANGSITSHTLYRNPLPLLEGGYEGAFLDLLFFLSLLKATLLSFPTPWPSFSLPRSLVMTSFMWHVWETSAGPLLQTGHWYTESAGWQGYFWSL